MRQTGIPVIHGFKKHGPDPLIYSFAIYQYRHRGANTR